MKLILTTLVALTLMATTALANNCGDRNRMAEILLEKYQEQVVFRGLQSPTQLLEVFANLETGTYTVFISSVEGTACAVASGNNFVMVEKKPLGERG